MSVDVDFEQAARVNHEAYLEARDRADAAEAEAIRLHHALIAIAALIDSNSDCEFWRRSLVLDHVRRVVAAAVGEV